MKIKSIFILAFLVLFYSSSFAQNSNNSFYKKTGWGLFIGGNELGILADGVVNNKYRIYSLKQSGYQGYEVGAFYRRRYNQLIIGSSVSYLRNSYFLQFVNLKPEEDTTYGAQGAWTHYGPVYKLQQVKASLMTGYYISNHLRFQLGIAGNFNIKDNFYANKPDEFFFIKSNYLDRVAYNYADSINEFTASGIAGLGYDIGRFSLDAYYEKTLTPYISFIHFDGNKHPIIQHYRLYKIRIGYSFK